MHRVGQGRRVPRRTRVLIFLAAVLIATSSSLGAGTSGTPAIHAEASPTLALTPDWFTCDTVYVQASGSGFTPNSNLTLSVGLTAGSGGTLQRTTATESGTFAVLIPVTDLASECRGAPATGGIQQLMVAANTGWQPPFGNPSAMSPLLFYSGITLGFAQTWARTDQPVATGDVDRTWIWGDYGMTGSMLEPYTDAVDGVRWVQYYDKARMEVTDPSKLLTDPWRVTNGLLVVELVTGQVQVGDVTFEPNPLGPATVPIVGDPDGDALTYAAVNAANLRASMALPAGTTITWRVAQDGSVEDDPTLATHSVIAAERVTLPGIDHTVAGPFWQFMNSEGFILHGDELTTDALFANPFYATGYPITEAYWTHTTVGGEPQDVLLQCFERRCLSYTPGNPAGWEVEAGNVGQHYFQWRYTEQQ